MKSVSSNEKSLVLLKLYDPLVRLRAPPRARLPAALLRLELEYRAGAGALERTG